MNLSSQDSLRLNVLLCQPLKAVRIDESRMIVHALLEEGEAQVELSPIGRHELYLRGVRQLFSTHVLGSPGGYPVFLKRWTRMGQAREQSLAKLLLLGEPEAVTAVVHAAGLTEDIAACAWWAAPTAENARRMLERDTVAGTETGRMLALFLLEFLPFEEEHAAMIDSVRLMLKPDLLEPEQRNRLWERAKRKPSYYVGFLKALPDALPEQPAAHPDYEALSPLLDSLARLGNRHVRQLFRCMGPAGQAFLKTLKVVLEKPVNQDVVVMALEACESYFSSVRPDGAKYRSIGAITERVEKEPDPEADEARALLKPMGVNTAARLDAMRSLSLCGEPLVAPLFGLTDAMGTVMRRKLEPTLGPLLYWISLLT